MTLLLIMIYIGAALFSATTNIAYEVFKTKTCEYHDFSSSDAFILGPLGSLIPIINIIMPCSMISEMVGLEAKLNKFFTKLIKGEKKDSE